MRRVIGMDIHRTFAEVVFREDGRLRWHGRIDMTRSGLEGFGRSLTKDDQVVLEATGNAMAVVRVLSPYVARVIMANPLQVKAIAHAHVKTDKIDAGVLQTFRTRCCRRKRRGRGQLRPHDRSADRIDKFPPCGGNWYDRWWRNR
jgi:hypothetical protein